MCSLSPPACFSSRWRGAAPIQRALIAGDEVVGASTFALEEGLDTGPVYGVMTERPEGWMKRITARVYASSSEMKLLGCLAARKIAEAWSMPTIASRGE